MSCINTRLGSSVRRDASGTGTSFRGDISTAIHPLQLIREEQLSVNGEIMYAKYWYSASGRLAKEWCG